MSWTDTLRGATGRGAQSASAELARGLGWFSVGLGLAELLAARSICRVIGLDGRETLVQAYGVREVATGVAILTSHDPTPWIWGRVGGDAIDLATLATGFRLDNPKSDNLTIAALLVAGVTALDLVCARGLVDDKRLSPPGAFDYRDRTGFPKPASAMRGAAANLMVPADFRIPELLRPWTDGRPAKGGA